MPIVGSGRYSPGPGKVLLLRERSYQEIRPTMAKCSLTPPGFFAIDSKLRRIRRLVRDVGPDEVVVYVDEVDIHLNPKIGLDWMLRGQQKEVLTPGQNQKRYLAGALDAHTERLTWVQGPRKTSLLFLDLLYELATRTYRTARRIHVILDNYGI